MTNCGYENKISDDEIISSLETIATTRNCDECKIRNCKWGDCDCSQIAANAALDLINRQKTEIEDLMLKSEEMHCIMTNSFKTKIKKLEDCAIFLSEILIHQMKLSRLDSTTRTKVYKSFAKNLKEWFDSNYDGPNIDFYKFIDNLLQEMLGEE